jgi:hypothetical protein
MKGLAFSNNFHIPLLPPRSVPLGVFFVFHTFLSISKELIFLWVPQQVICLCIHRRFKLDIHYALSFTLGGMRGQLVYFQTDWSGNIPR